MKNCPTNECLTLVAPDLNPINPPICHRFMKGFLVFMFTNIIVESTPYRTVLGCFLLLTTVLWVFMLVARCVLICFQETATVTIVQNDNPGGTFEFYNDSSVVLQVLVYKLLC